VEINTQEGGTCSFRPSRKGPVIRCGDHQNAFETRAGGGRGGKRDSPKRREGPHGHPEEQGKPPQEGKAREERAFA